MINSVNLDHPEWEVATTFAIEHPRRAVARQPWRRWLRQRRPVVVAVLSAFVTVSIVASLAFGSSYLANNTVDQQSQAAVLGTATLDWPEQNLNLPAGQVTRLKLTANPGANVIDGVQAVVAISGTNVPPMQFIPNTAVTGLDVAAATLSQNGNGQLLQVALVSQYPELGFSASSQALSLGELVFTPSSGTQVKLAFDGAQTVIVDHGTGQNLIGTLINQTYAFQAEPSVFPTPIPSPSPVSSPVASPVVSPIPSPSPSVPPVTNEVMVVNKAVETKYPFGFYRVEVSVSDSLAPNVRLTASDFGTLSYNKKTKLYTGAWYSTKGPFSQIKIVSSTGKEIVAPLQQKIVRMKLFR